MCVCVCVCGVPAGRMGAPAVLYSATRREGRMSRASVPHSGRARNPNLAGSNPGRIKPMTLKLILVAS